MKNFKLAGYFAWVDVNGARHYLYHSYVRLCRRCWDAPGGSKLNISTQSLINAVSLTTPAFARVFFFADRGV